MNKVFNTIKKKYPSGKNGWIIIDEDGFLVYFHKASKRGIMFGYENGKVDTSLGKMDPKDQEFDYMIVDEGEHVHSEKDFMNKMFPVLDTIFDLTNKDVWSYGRIKMKENITGKRKATRKALEVRVSWTGKSFIINWQGDKSSGPVHFTGTREEFARMLQKLQAKDSLTKPLMKRQLTYKEMVDNIIEQKDCIVMIWSNVLDNIKGTMFNMNTLRDIFREEYEVDQRKDNYFKGII